MSKKAHEKRKDLILSITRNFITQHEKKHTLEIEFDEDSIDSIVALYFNQLDKNIKRHLIEVKGEKRINVFKIISLTELCVMYCKPLSHPSYSDIANRTMNAELSYHVARTMLQTWVEEFGVTLTPRNLSETIRNELTAFRNNHVKWLARQTDSHITFPVYPNTHSWKLFFFILSNCSKESETLVKNES